MKTPIELRKLYKEETGQPFSNIEIAVLELEDDWGILTLTEYIEWLEEKVMSEKCINQNKQ